VCVFPTNCREPEQVEGCVNEKEGMGLKKKPAAGLQEESGGMKKGCIASSN